MSEVKRMRTIEWEDPRATARAAGEMSGLEFLHAIGRGELPPPPFSTTLGIEPEAVGEGYAVFFVDPAEYHYNPIGVVHGGLAAALCDTAMGCAVHSTLPAGRGYTTIEMKVNFVRPITPAVGRLRCEGRVVHRGRRLATAETRVLDAEGRLYAHATETCMLLGAEPAE